MTTPFYAPPDAFTGDHLVLPPDEARHATRVLRHGAGDELVVVDGVGGWHRVRLDQVGRDRAAGTVVESRREVGEASYDLTVGLALLKNRNRYETFLEKAVELGVDRVIPLQTRRTEKAKLRADRARKIMVAAMKQSGRSRLPVLEETTALSDVLADTSAYDRALLCHEGTGADASVAARLAGGVAGECLAVLVGPEGGFDEVEVEGASAEGWELVSLGPRRLRAETAALTVAAAVHLFATAIPDTSPDTSTP